MSVADRTSNTNTLDPVTFEILRSSVTGVVDEMVLIIVRTAHSSVVKDNMDFSTAFCDPAGRVVAQGLSLPLHLGSIPDAMNEVIARYGESVAPGDTFILNDPYAGGMHLPDIFVITPAYSGSELLGYAVCVCHHTDVGGRVPGSNACDSTEIYQEGLRIPPLRLFRGGEPDVSLFALLEANVRVPDSVLGDLRAQQAACFVAEREMRQIAERFGNDTLQEYFSRVLDYSERRARAAFERWPDGRYEFTDYVDDDGLGGEPVTIKVALTVDHDEIEADFTGSSDQVGGALNATFSFTKAAVYAAVKYVIGGDIPNNAGFFRPIHVIAPEGSVLNARSPAACAARGVTGFRTADCMLGALSQACPDRVFAASEGGNTGISIGGYTADGGPFVFVDFICSSWGARWNRDGIDGITNPFQNLANESVELTEIEHPLRIERYEFVPDTGGIGEFRGGLGVVRDYQFLEDAAVLQIRSDRRRFRPYGLCGGGSGAPSANYLNPSDENVLLPTKFTRPLHLGDTVRIVLPGGGGYGDPLKRDLALLEDDLRQGKITRDSARRDYGVEFDGTAGTIDVAATKLRREALRRDTTRSTGRES